MYYGCKKEVNDKRDYKMYVCGAKQTQYPTSYEITTPYVKDQGIVNSCVAHTLSEFLEETHKDNNIKFSTGFIYGYRPIGYSLDEGMYPRQALKTLAKIGNVKYEDFNHNKEMPEIKQLVDNNIDNLKQKASEYKIISYSRIYTKNEIIKCLYNDITVPISIPVYNNLKLDENNVILEPDGECEGYHMMLLCGWNEKGYIVQNSWGKDWGNNGRAILPYNYKIDSAWAISTEDNQVYTYTTMFQKIYGLFIKLISKIRK